MFSIVVGTYFWLGTYYWLPSIKKQSNTWLKHDKKITFKPSTLKVAFLHLYCFGFLKANHKVQGYVVAEHLS